MSSPAGALAASSAWPGGRTPWWWWWSPWWTWTSPSGWPWCWTAAWWRRVIRPPAARCPGCGCWGRPRPPCWRPSGRCSRGPRAGPERIGCGPAPSHQSVLWSGCWRLWAAALRENNVTYIQECWIVDSSTFTKQGEKKAKTERQIICPVANESNKLRVDEANPGNLL